MHMCAAFWVWAGSHTTILPSPNLRVVLFEILLRLKSGPTCAFANCCSSKSTAWEQPSPDQALAAHKGTRAGKGQQKQPWRICTTRQAESISSACGEQTNAHQL